MAENKNTMEALLSNYAAWNRANYSDSVTDQSAKIRNEDKNLRSSVRIAGVVLNSDLSGLTVEMLENSLDTVIDGIKRRYPSGGAYSGHISRLRKLLAWAIARGLLAVSHKRLIEAGYPTIRDFLGEEKNWDAQAFTRRFFAVGFINGKRIEQVTAKDYQLLVHWIDFDSERRQTSSTVFLRAWDRLAKTLKLNNLVTSKELKTTDRYGVNLEDLPESLRLEFLQAIETLKTPAYKTKYGEKCLGDASVHIFTATFLQFFGYLAKTKKQSLAGLTLHSLITMKNIIEFLEFTNERSRRSVEQWKQLDQKENNTFGYSQLTYLVQFKRLVSRHLDNGELHRQLCTLDSKIHTRVESRREAFKEVEPLDSWWKMSYLLLDQSNDSGMCQKERAQFRRDALIFALLSLLAYRREILESLTVKQVTFDNGCYIVQIDKAKTKPRSRDLWHEIPTEFTFLIQHYLEIERPILRGQKEDCGSLLLTKDGKPLLKRSISTLVKRHTDRFGEKSNVHQARKSWTTDFLRWANGDYVTATAILDSAAETLEEYYDKTQAAERVHRNFDPARSKARNRAIVKNEGGQPDDSVY